MLNHISEEGRGLSAVLTEPDKQPLEDGRVRWFDKGRGFGFIIPDNGGVDVFIFIEVCKRHGLPDGLSEGQRVRFISEVKREGKNPAVTYIELAGN